jgi:predicted metal-dependent peptidase
MPKKLDRPDPQAITPEEKLRLVQQRATVYYPMFGALLSYCRFVEDKSGKAGTMKALKTGHILYDRECVDVTPDGVLLSLLVHTILHEALKEKWRACFHNPIKYRVAMEAKINQILEEGGLKLGPGFYREPKWDTLATEECLGDVDDNITQEQAEKMCPVCLPIVLDPIQDEQENGGGSDEQEIPTGSIWTSALVQMDEIAKDVGNEMLGLKLAIGELYQAQIPWQTRLRQFCRENFGKKGRSYRRPKKRSWSLGTLLPGPNKGLGSPLIAIDLSGSVVGDKGLVEDFLAEVCGILKVTNQKARFVFHEVGIVEDFESDDMKEVIEKIRGGGGTSFVPLYEEISRQHPRPNVVIHMTDLFGEFPAFEPNYPVLFVVGEYSAETPGWGEKLELPSQRKDQRKPHEGF